MVDTVVIKSDAPVEDPAKLEELAKKGTAAVEGAKPSDQGRPDWLPEKFQSPEDMAKAYQELEKKLGSNQQQQQQEPKKEGEADPEANPKKTENNLQVEEQVESKGFSMADLQQEYNENGALSEETYEKLGKAGFSREDVDTYIEGRKAIITNIENQGYELVGGKESYEAMKEWARANVSPEAIAAFNKAVADPETRELAIQGLNAKYRAAVGNEPSTKLNTSASRSGPTDVYESRAQLTADMNNPLYKTDPAFRQKVTDKLSRSDIF